MAKPQWITNERVEQIGKAKNTIPSIKKSSRRDFRQPPTIESDFQRWLDHDIPHVNYTFELIRDWYAAQEDGYEPVYIRAQQTPIDWKSKIGNSDMSTNFKTSYKEIIHKGDYVIREDGMIYMLNWNVTNHPNNQASQNVQCNDTLTFTRKHMQKVDEYGFVVEQDDVVLDDNGREIVVYEIPVSHSEYAGRPDYSVAQNQPGIIANNLLNIQVQWNSETRKIRIDDTVQIGCYTYRILNVYTGQINMNKQYGCLYLQAKRQAGGGLDDQ